MTTPRRLFVAAALAAVLAACGSGGTKSANSTIPPPASPTSATATSAAETGATASGSAKLRIVNLFGPAVDVHDTDSGDQVLAAGLAFGAASDYLPVSPNATTVVDTAGKHDDVAATGSKVGGPDLQSTMVIVPNPDKARVADIIFFTERNAAMDQFALPAAPVGKALLFANAEALPFGKSPDFDLGTASGGCLTKETAQENVAVSGNQTIRYPLPRATSTLSRTRASTRRLARLSSSARSGSTPLPATGT